MAMQTATVVGQPERLPGVRLLPDEVLERIPQRPPFRFVERILEIDEERVLATAHFPGDAAFYRGHFPGHPITPGVLLLEAMAQAALTSHAIYLIALEHGTRGLDSLEPLFTNLSAEFRLPVGPDERVTIQGRRIVYRRGKLRSRVEMRNRDGRLVCVGSLSGIGVSQ